MCVCVLLNNLNLVLWGHMTRSHNYTVTDGYMIFLSNQHSLLIISNSIFIYFHKRVIVFNKYTHTQTNTLHLYRYSPNHHNVCSEVYLIPLLVIFFCSTPKQCNGERPVMPLYESLFPYLCYPYQ